jgi:DNA-binding MarR family transcriptional regulator
MESDMELTAQGLGQSVWHFTKAFMQFHKAELQQSFKACTPGAIGVLFTIREGTKAEVRPMKVSEISRQMRVTSPSITQFIKELEACGLVERRVDLTDRRVVGILLTRQGEKVAQQVEALFSATFCGLAEYMGEKESNQLAELLSKAFRYFNERDVSSHRISWNGDEGT